MIADNSVPCTPREHVEGGSKSIVGGHSRCTRGPPLLSLPLDSLHCVASFLTPVDWSNLGQTGRSASNTSREIFRRVRMHGFRCATEIVTAWVGPIVSIVLLGALHEGGMFYFLLTGSVCPLNENNMS